MDKIEGDVIHITFHSEETSFTVIEIDTGDEEITVVGNMVGIAPGQHIVAQGSYVNHPSFGVQFKVSTYEVSLPSDSNAILSYLSSGIIKGIGKATAKKIVSKFGTDTFFVLRSDPEKLSTISGITKKQAESIHDEFSRIYGLQDTIFSLAKYNIDAVSAVSLYECYGSRTAELINENPYILCDSPTIYDFDFADSISKTLAFEYDSDVRIEGGIFYIMRHNMQNGHTCLPVEKVISTTADFINVEPSKVENTMQSLCDYSRLITEKIDEKEFVYLPDMYVSEVSSCEKISRLLRQDSQPFSDIDSVIEAVQYALGIEYADNQKKALRTVAENNVCIITGGPGTGKTTLVKGIINMFEMTGDIVYLCAPTGRAAKRLSELSSKEAKTIHRLLEVLPGSKRNIRFNYNKDHPLKCDVLIVDEFSMVDITLFNRLITSIKDETRVVFVGDYNQLPAVGPGNILKDMLDSGRVPNIQLTEIFRQAQQSDIVVNAHAINNGVMPLTSGKNGDYFFIDANENIPELISDLVKRRLPNAYGFSTDEDIQILSPSRKKTGGTQNLNTILQQNINPPRDNKKQITVNGIVFRVGDKVMQIKNNYDIEGRNANGDVEAGVFNGDIGRIVAIDTITRGVSVKIDDKIYEYTAEELTQLEHAWAITVHKSQGSEFKAVIFVLSDTAKELQYRNLLYTAFTRAKELLVVVGSREILVNMVSNDKKKLRYSGIKHFLDEYCIEN